MLAKSAAVAAPVMSARVKVSYSPDGVHCAMWKVKVAVARVFVGIFFA